MRRAILVAAVIVSLVAGSANACEWWTCASIDGSHVTCGKRFDEGGGDTYAGLCREVCDCPPGEYCGCFCEYKLFCFSI